METKEYERKEVGEDGSVRYYNAEGRLHREGGPALEEPNGTKMWYRNGKLHREDGPAYEGPDGVSWYAHGEIHREDGPAREWADGSKEWYWEGKRHRFDGPAVRKSDGTKEYWILGNRMTGREFLIFCHPKSVPSLEKNGFRDRGIPREAFDSLSEMPSRKKTPRMGAMEAERRRSHVVCSC